MNNASEVPPPPPPRHRAVTLSSSSWAAPTVSVEVQRQQAAPHGVDARVAAFHRRRGEHGVVVVALLDAAPVLGEHLKLGTLQTCSAQRLKVGIGVGRVSVGRTEPLTWNTYSVGT